MHDDADGEAEEAVDLAHPLGIALGEIVVDGDDVDAVAGERVEVARESGDECLAFAGLHLGDLAGVEDHAADHLDVEVAHTDDAAAGFADDGEGFGEKIVEGEFFCGFDLFFIVETFDGLGDAGAEFEGLGGELLVGEGDGGFVEGVDLGEDGEQLFDGALVAGAEDFGEDFVEQDGFLLRLDAAGETRAWRNRNLWFGGNG